MKLSPIFLASICLLVVNSCQEDRLTWALDDSNKLIATGQYQQAEHLSLDLLKKIKDQSTPVARQQKAAILRNLAEIELKYHNDGRAALSWLRQLIELVDDNEKFQVRLQMADIYERDLQMPAELVFILRSLISTAEVEQLPELDQLYFRLATNLFTIHRYDQAREIIHSLIKNCPDSDLLFKGQVLVANSFFIQEDYHKAIAVYRALLEGDPEPEERGIILFEIGSCYQMLSEQTTALDYYKQSLPCHPNPQMVQHHIDYLKVLVENANVEKKLKRSLLEQVWLKQAYQESAD